MCTGRRARRDAKGPWCIADVGDWRGPSTSVAQSDYTRATLRFLASMACKLFCPPEWKEFHGRFIPCCWSRWGCEKLSGASAGSSCLPLLAQPDRALGHLSRKLLSHGPDNWTHRSDYSWCLRFLEQCIQ